jgi:UDP-N-acetylmuramoylalanine--D-glutamate ligase
VGSWSGKRVTLMGLGLHGGGVGAARWLARQGARLTITDLADATALRSSLEQIAGIPVARLCLGRHDEEDFRSADVVIVNPAVRPDNSLLTLARQRGAQVVTEIELLLNHAPPPVIAVTGSNGKTTTADMLRAMLEAGGKRVWLGGNIGGSLLGDLDQMRDGDWLVVELSSFQLHYLSEKVVAPRIAIVTKCTPNHLDWHGDFAAYQRAKRRLLELQDASGTAVINPAAASLVDWHERVRGTPAAPYPDDLIPPLRSPGRHFRQNAACAAAAAKSAGISDEAIRRALENYRSLPHRIEPIEHAARRFYNDSKATTPEATVAAMEAVDPPVWLLAGGYAKGGNYAALAETVVRGACGAALFGTAGPMLAELIRRYQPDFPHCVTEDLDEAFPWTMQHSRAGDCLLLSPACASFDQYRDYVERGEHFRRLVGQLPP